MATIDTLVSNSDPDGTAEMPIAEHLALRTGSFGTRLRRLLHGAIETTELMHDPREREVAREFMNAAFFHQLFTDLFFPDGSRQPSRALQRTVPTNAMKSRLRGELPSSSSLQQAPEPAGD